MKRLIETFPQRQEGAVQNRVEYSEACEEESDTHCNPPTFHRNANGPLP